MEQKIKDILEKLIYTRQGIVIKPQASSKLVADLGLDSLDQVLLLLAIEEEFLIQIPREYNTYNYVTVQDIIDVAYKVKEELYGQDKATV